MDQKKLRNKSKENPLKKKPSTITTKNNTVAIVTDTNKVKPKQTTEIKQENKQPPSKPDKHNNPYEANLLNFQVDSLLPKETKIPVISGSVNKNEKLKGKVEIDVISIMKNIRNNITGLNEKIEEIKGKNKGLFEDDKCYESKEVLLLKKEILLLKEQVEYYRKKSEYLELVFFSSKSIIDTISTQTVSKEFSFEEYFNNLSNRIKYIYTEAQKTFLDTYAKPLKLQDEEEALRSSSKEMSQNLENTLLAFLSSLNETIKSNNNEKFGGNLKRLCCSVLKNLMSLYLTEKPLIFEFKQRPKFILDDENNLNYQSKKRAEELRKEIGDYLKSKNSHVKLNQIKEIQSKCCNFINFYENLLLIHKKEDLFNKESLEKALEDSNSRTVFLNKFTDQYLINSESSIQILKDLMGLCDGEKSMKFPEKIIYNFVVKEKENIFDFIEKWTKLKNEIKN